MAFSAQNRSNTLNGVLFVALFSMAATYIADFTFFKNMAISPLIIGIVIGIFYANTLRGDMPKEWTPGVIFSTKTLLRVAIVFYGFRLTFTNIEEVGLAGIVASVSIVASTFIIGYIVGTKVLKLDRDTTILTSAGSSICGAAAVLATESAINAKPEKSAVAVSTVVIFGMIAMFLYPVMYKMGFLGLDEKAMGLYVGSTLHEVANVVGAGNALGNDGASVAVITKMLRVMLIAPFLLILGWFLIKLAKSSDTSEGAGTKMVVPWFAVLFLVVIAFNSYVHLPKPMIDIINSVDTFAMTMAMTALGMETTASKFKSVGAKPFYLALILFAWLLVGGYFITIFAVSL